MEDFDDYDEDEGLADRHAYDDEFNEDGDWFHRLSKGCLTTAALIFSPVGVILAFVLSELMDRFGKEDE